MKRQSTKKASASKASAAKAKKATTTKKAATKPKAKSSVAAATVKKTPLKITVQNLRRFNVIAAVLYAVQAVAIILLSTSNNVYRPLNLNLQTADSFSNNGQLQLVQASRHLFDINLILLVTLFLLVGAVGHLLVAVWLRKKYEQDVKVSQNRYRWLVMGVNQGLVLVTLALLAGFDDVVSLLFILGLVFMANVFGFAWEHAKNHNLKKHAKLSYWVSMVLVLLPWVGIGLNLLGSYLYGDATMPAFLWWLFGTSFVVFLAGGMVMKKQAKGLGRWSDYNFVEYAYIRMAVLINAVVAWQIFFNILKK